ncbi:MAG TPA: hypothetical protein VHY56_03430 [Candidatus Binataceae bacterium]|nr:hypothetical protein [Candidatus Binataceae bacterium]
MPVGCFVISANLNNLTGSGSGVNNTGDDTDVIVNASNDYWGCRNGPGTPNCTSINGDVHTFPFLSFPAFIIGLTLP